MELAIGLDRKFTLKELVKRATDDVGLRVTRNTPRTVADALARVPTVVPLGNGAYAPARIAFDGKAFRVHLDERSLETKAISVSRLAPFYSVLGQPAIVSNAGALRPVTPVDVDRSDGLLDLVADQVRRHFAVTFPDLAEFVTEELLLKSVKSVQRDRVQRGLSGLIDLSALFIVTVNPGWETVDVVFRWHRRREALVASLEGPGERDELEIQREDKALGDFLSKKLPRQNSLLIHELLLQAYAQSDEVGMIPGSPAAEVVAADARIRTVNEGTHRRVEGDLAIARAEFRTLEERNDPAWQEYSEWIDGYRDHVESRIKTHRVKCDEAWRRVCDRLGLSRSDFAGPGLSPKEVEAVRRYFPTSEGLIGEWKHALADRGLSEKVTQRKVGHLKTLAHYLEHNEEGEGHLLLVDEGVLNAFFFWDYIRRWGGSPSGARTFPLDVRDFYRFQEEKGRIKDSRFAQLFHGLRECIAERAELYDMLDPDHPKWEELYEELFL